MENRATFDNEEVRAFGVGARDDFEEEIARTRENEASMKFLDERSAKVQPGKGTSLEEIRQRIDG